MYHTLSICGRSSDTIFGPYLVMNLSGCQRRLAALRAACSGQQATNARIRVRVLFAAASLCMIVYIVFYMSCLG